MAYDNTNTGILSRNERKETDSHPDFTGTINVDGVDYWLSGWTKEGKPGGKMEGKRFFSLSVKPKDAQAAPKRKPEPEPVGGSFNDDIPFADPLRGRAALIA
jgi:hypothetical protein